MPFFQGEVFSSEGGQQLQRSVYAKIVGDHLKVRAALQLRLPSGRTPTPQLVYLKGSCFHVSHGHHGEISVPVPVGVNGYLTRNACIKHNKIPASCMTHFSTTLSLCFNLNLCAVVSCFKYIQKYK